MIFVEASRQRETQWSDRSLNGDGARTCSSNAKGKLLGMCMKMVRVTPAERTWSSVTVLNPGFRIQHSHSSLWCTYRVPPGVEQFYSCLLIMFLQLYKQLHLPNLRTVYSLNCCPFYCIQHDILIDHTSFCIPFNSTHQDI